MFQSFQNAHCPNVCSRKCDAQYLSSTSRLSSAPPAYLHLHIDFGDAQDYSVWAERKRQGKAALTLMASALVLMRGTGSLGSKRAMRLKALFGCVRDTPHAARHASEFPQPLKAETNKIMACIYWAVIQSGQVNNRCNPRWEHSNFPSIMQMHRIALGLWFSCSIHILLNMQITSLS